MIGLATRANNRHRVSQERPTITHRERGREDGLVIHGVATSIMADIGGSGKTTFEK